MKIEDLQVFMEVARCKSFSIAGENLYMAQSSVSKCIMRLENQLELPLFIRKHAAIDLSPSGAELYRRCGEFLSLYETIIRRVKTFSDVVPVNIVGTTPLMKFNLPELFDQFRAAHQNINLNIQHFELVEEALEVLGEYPNLLITYQTDAYQSVYNFKPLYQDHLVAILPCEETISTTEISLLDYMDNNIYLTSRSLRQEILDYFLPTGVVPKLINLTSGPRREVALRNVMNGRGISICYESDISIYKIISLKVCSIKEFPSCALCLGVKKDHITTNHEQMLISTLISYSQNSICPMDF